MKRHNNLNLIIDKNLHVLCVTETKIDNLFPIAQFRYPGYHKTYRLDISDKRQWRCKNLKQVTQNFMKVFDVDDVRLTF